MENPALEIEKLNVSLDMANRCIESATNELALARLKIRHLEAQIEAAKPKP